MQPAGGGPVTGTVAVTEGADTSSASGLEVFTGSSAVTEGADASAVAAVEVFTGTSSTTNAPDTSAVTALEVFVGTSTATNAPDTSSASGLEVFAGSSATTNAPDVSAASGSVSGTTITGSAAVVEGPDVSSSSGTITLNWFKTPTVRRKAGDRRLYDLYTMDKGVSVVLIDGHYRRYPIPPHTMLLPLVAGRDYFIGGTAAVVVTSAVATALTADGFTVYDHNPDED